MKRSSLWPALGLFVLLAIAVATIWGFTVGFLVTTWEERTRSGVSEHLAIRFDGEPMIESYSTVGGVYKQLPQRTLDGQEIRGPRYGNLPGADVDNPPRRRSWSDGPVRWAERIARMDRGNKRWLVIHDGRLEGRAYIACYDLDTKLPIGYIGRKGFTTSLPPAADQFAVGSPFRYDARNIAGVQLNINHMSFGDVEPGTGAPPWCIYLLDGDKLIEVDVRGRTLRTLIESGVQSIELVQRPTPLENDELQNVSTENWTGNIRKEPAEMRLLASLKDTIAVLNPAANQRDDFKLPEEFRTGGMNVYALGPEELLISRLRNAKEGPIQGGPRQHTLTWLNNAGEQAKEVEVEVGGYNTASDLVSVLIGAMIVPSLIFMALMVFWFAPFSLVAAGSAASYGDAVREGLQVTWPVALGVLLLSLVAAWLVVRWQRKYDRPHTAAWAIAVFILGVPGLLAYMIHHGFPPRTPCPACGAVVPRRREACAACGDSFPAPALTGTEVFA